MAQMMAPNQTAQQKEQIHETIANVLSVFVFEETHTKNQFFQIWNRKPQIYN